MIYRNYKEVSNWFTRQKNLLQNKYSRLDKTDENLRMYKKEIDDLQDHFYKKEWPTTYKDRAIACVIEHMQINDNDKLELHVLHIEAKVRIGKMCKSLNDCRNIFHSIAVFRRCCFADDDCTFCNNQCANYGVPHYSAEDVDRLVDLNKYLLDKIRL